MKRVGIVNIVVLFLITNLYGVNSSYLKTKIKNRAELQKKTGAFKHSKYNYVSQREIKAARYNNNANLGVVDIKRGEHIRDANVYVESNSKIKIRNNKNSKVQVGVINVDKRARLKTANITVKARNGIDIRQQKGGNRRTSQVGVVNMRKSSKVKDIRTRVESHKKINIRSY